TMEGTNYLDKNSLQLDADMEIDLEEQRYTFKENQAILNRLPLTFEGFVRILEEGQELDLKFKTINSDFKNFLAMIPEKYSKDITELATEGNFELSGHFRGELNEETIPEFNIRMIAHNASFQYPQFPKKVKNIEIDALLENSTGRSEDTSIKIEHAGFQIDKDVFELQAVLTELNGNTGVDAHASGSINLDKLSQAYPMPASMVLGGILSGELSSAFTRDDIEKENYKNITLNGDLELRGLHYNFDALPNPIKVHTCKAELGPKTIDIKELAGITGSTDFSATGTLRNALGYIFNDEVLKGNFEMRSNAFVVADIVRAEQTESSSAVEEDSFKVPEYLDLTLNALVGKAVYDNIVMYDLSGILRIRDQTISFSEISSRMLDGRLQLDGMLTTKDQAPMFNMSIDLSRLNIGKTFEAIELVRLLSPAANILDGRVNSKIKLSGGLTQQLDLDLSTLSGDMLAEILTAEIRTENSKVTKLLDDRLGFLALDELDLSGLKTALKFENGKVNVEPFKLRYKDIDLMFSGGHSFSKALDYKLTLNVPARYMGEDVNKLLAGIGDESLKELTVPVVANLKGSVTDPEISTDLKSQTKVLADQLVDIQKKKYIDKGKKELSGIIGGVLAGSSANNTNDSTKETDAGNPVIGSGSTKTDQIDSTGSVTEKGSEEENIREAAKNILGGLLKSKSKSVTAKDTVN
ncbi:MAG: AsmA-like C-terminal region-containing protein, partial [Flavobacteriaceae bacterium]